MAKQTDRRYAALIVSTSEQFNHTVKQILAERRFAVMEVKKSASLARRELVSGSYDLVVIHAPLSDELGIEFVCDVEAKYDVEILMACPGEIAGDVSEQMVDKGVFVVPRPIEGYALEEKLRLACAVCDKKRELLEKIQAMEDKMEEQRLVNQAKWVLIDAKHMTESEAHRFIGKTAMNRCVSKKVIAKQILADLDD